jgi:hypothetical protein
MVGEIHTVDAHGGWRSPVGPREVEGKIRDMGSGREERSWQRPVGLEVAYTIAEEQVAGEEPRGEAPTEERKKKEMAVSRSREPAVTGAPHPSPAAAVRPNLELSRQRARAREKREEEPAAP